MTESARLIAGIAAAVIAVPIVLAYPIAVVPVIATAAIGSALFGGSHQEPDRPLVDESLFAREIAQLTDENLAWALRTWGRGSNS
ncbi:hypothetical protein B5P44_01260 [Mycobacterium sp. CBMA 213]|uniref:Uncharacterized protein n=1 Tax=Mycolicibacterium sp. CBMA 213 TaxID=1968788 RepID=A0A343VRP7_9MYCO|nr:MULTISPECIES: hypothetical protein [unclassified Mycolicibacterium]AVN58571.1 hypothetical protein B5P44_p00276 [Mycolicibacterium sp. CBMA 213]MUL61212.1 hypothetical protein [Mycolicibacterium sp. CBMA 335]MUM03449.1 hypothetical protein [Mycolicibacterium sp. CBMA 213]